jgi:hypothetical protein
LLRLRLLLLLGLVFDEVWVGGVVGCSCGVGEEVSGVGCQQ